MPFTRIQQRGVKRQFLGILRSKNIWRGISAGIFRLPSPKGGKLNEVFQELLTNFFLFKGYASFPLF